MSSRLELDELRERIGAGDVDTVLVAFPDLQGRLMGKRVTGHYFLDHVVDGEGIEACNYLLAVDVEMTPVPGYRFANWEQGYGDMKAVPDFARCVRSPGSRKPRSCCATSSTKRPRHRSRCRPDGSSSVRSSVPRPPVT